jgi:hypothetical protein
MTHVSPGLGGTTHVPVRERPRSHTAGGAHSPGWPVHAAPTVSFAAQVPPDTISLQYEPSAHSGLEVRPQAVPEVPLSAHVPLMVHVCPETHGCAPLQDWVSKLRLTHVPSQLIAPKSSPTHAFPGPHSEKPVASDTNPQLSPSARNPQSTLSHTAGNASAPHDIAWSAATHALASAAESKFMRPAATAGPQTAQGSSGENTRAMSFARPAHRSRNPT